ncbi:MAG: ABC transporter ATP-binding protein [Clostridia bacterium]|nr:ABC transporter ATP-binding protein [Clostridia bacterium]
MNEKSNEKTKPGGVIDASSTASRPGAAKKNHNKIIELKHISMRFPSTGMQVLNDISLDIHDNEFVTLLGPSGCGKTTTLRIIGGFAKPDTGDVLFNGERINNLPPHKRNINTVFQKYALFSHLNVFENVAFGLRISKVPEKEIKTRVSEMLEIVDLAGFEKRNINNLSGGQQQRVAIARALVNNPKVLLLDEPLGALDLKLRQEMQIELKKIQQRMSITFIYVTHDQEEALTMSDTVVVMKDGVIQQIGTPQDIYNEPINAFVANFIGESNILPGIMHKDYLVEFAGNNFECVDKGFSEMEPVDVVIRPEDITIVPASDEVLNGIVESVTFKGVHYEIVVNAYSDYWLIHSTKSAAVGQVVGMDFTPEDIHIMKKSEMPKITRFTALRHDEGSGENGVEE